MCHKVSRNVVAIVYPIIQDNNIHSPKYSIILCACREMYTDGHYFIADAINFIII